MTVRELDRLVTKTAISPASKRALKDVRRAVMTGTCGDPEVASGRWSISLDTSAGQPVHMTFSFRRENDGSN